MGYGVPCSSCTHFIEHSKSIHKSCTCVVHIRPMPTPCNACVRRASLIIISPDLPEPFKYCAHSQPSEPCHCCRDCVCSLSADLIWSLILACSGNVAASFQMGHCSCRRLGYLRSLGPVTVTILGIAIVNIFHLQCPTSDKNKVCATTIRVVGHIPKGLPGCTIGWWSPIPQVGKKLGYAIIICLIDVLESISIAKALALKNRYQIK